MPSQRGRGREQESDKAAAAVGSVGGKDGTESKHHRTGKARTLVCQTVIDVAVMMANI